MRAVGLGSLDKEIDRQQQQQAARERFRGFGNQGYGGYGGYGGYAGGYGGMCDLFFRVVIHIVHDSSNVVPA